MAILSTVPYTTYPEGVDVAWVFYAPTVEDEDILGPSHCDMMIVLKDVDDRRLEPMIHHHLFPTTSAYTYLKGSVRVYYYADSYKDSPSDCERMFVAGNEGNSEEHYLLEVDDG